MARKENKTIKSLKILCNSHALDSDEVFHKAKLLLSSYRQVVWSTVQDVNCVRESTSDLYCSNQLDVAMMYLSEFAPTETRAAFEEKLTCLFETRYMISLIDKAMDKIYEYPDKGKLFHELLSKSYMTAFTYTEGELLDVLNLERSTFFDRKREAIFLFGISLWGDALPEFKVILSNYTNLQEDT